VTITTTGDKRQDVALSAIGGKGVFIKELEEALERGAIDVAVHSLKDVPSIIPPQFALAGFLERADARDAWLHPDRRSIGDLPAGAKIGTSAPRRHAQLLDRFPHLKIEPIRGNVESRINKMHTGQFAGVVLASAGLTRLGRASEITNWFSIDDMVPAAGQGIIVIETLASNDNARAAASALSASSSAGGPPGRSAVISSDHTVNFASFALPYDVESAQSTASRPRPITTRPTRGVLCRASNVYQRPPTYASNQVWKSIGTSGGSIAMSGRYPNV